MCGIAFYRHSSQSAQSTRAQVQNMSQKVLHRGPDASGFYMQSYWGMAHTRLSILDLHARANQPFHFKDYTLIFNGCIYNYIELRTELVKLGFSFETSSDTEVVLKSYIAWGAKALNKMNGMWAIAIYHAQTDDLFIARDRFGIKPLYYVKNEHCFALASEVKQLIPIVGDELDEEAQHAYFMKGKMVFDDRTFYRDIKIFPAGHWAKYRLSDHDWILQRFYTLPRLELSYDKTDIQSLLMDAVRIRLRADVPIGITVSGGVDSSLISLMAAEENTADFSLYNAAFPGYANDESLYAQILADHLHRPLHKSVSHWSELASHIQSLSYLQDLPLGSFSVFASYQLQQKMAAAGIKVVLSGQGADEIFGGYLKFHYYFLRGLWGENPIQLIREGYYLGQRMQYHPRKLWEKWQQQQIQKVNQWPKWYRGTPRVDRDVPSPLSESYALWEVSHQLIFGMGLPIMLHALDRNSMANGIEARCPFLDHRVVEMAVNLPDKLKIDRGIRKKILRELLADQWPNQLKHRYAKQGYSSPQREWMKKYLPNILQDISAMKSVITPYLSVEEFCAEMKSRPHWAMIWRVWAWQHWRMASVERR